DDPLTTAGFPADQLLLAETLRRLGRFEEARVCCHRGLSGRPGEPIRSLLEFEGELITSEDTEPHPVSEVLARGMEVLMAGPRHEPPLFAGTILGLRAWSVGIDPGTLRPRLTAHYGSTVWEAGGRWTRAECLSGTHPTGAPLPAEGCSCGLYALLPS